MKYPPKQIGEKSRNNSRCVCAHIHICLSLCVRLLTCQESTLLLAQRMLRYPLAPCEPEKCLVVDDIKGPVSLLQVSFCV